MEKEEEEKEEEEEDRKRWEISWASTKMKSLLS